MFSILEAWTHRPEGTTDVIGILLGTKSQNIVTLHEAHYIQHSVNYKEDPRDTPDVECDLQRVQLITGMQRSGSPDLQLVGWFSTNTTLSHSHRIIHNSFANQFTEPNLCLLTVDVSLTTDSIPTTLYTHTNALPIADATSKYTSLLTMFTAQPLQTIIPAQERLALHQMVSGRADETFSLNAEQFDMPVAINPPAQASKEANRQLGAALTTALQYVDEVLSGAVEGDVALGKQLAYICANVPVSDQDTLDGFFAHSLDDLNLFSQLANNTRSAVASAQLLPDSTP